MSSENGVDLSAVDTSWPEIEIESWKQLRSGIDARFADTDPTHNVNIFRGQANADWSLVPTIIRPRGSYTLSAAELVKLESDLEQKFLGQAHLHLNPWVLEKEDDVMALWALMQHYGAPTRALDWSASALVALYFAVVEKRKKPGAVWFVHVPALIRTMKRQFPDYDPLIEPQVATLTEKLRDPKADARLQAIQRVHHTDRMIAQQGVFTVCTNVLRDHADVIGTMQLHGETGLEKWIIPARLKSEILANLKSMNITASALFPGIDGLGRSLEELATLRSYALESGRTTLPAD